MPEMRKRDGSRKTNLPGIILGSIGVTGVLCLVTMFVYWVTPNELQVSYPTAIIRILPAPTYTPTLEATLQPTQAGGNQSEGGRTGEPIFIGAYVEIKGTEGDGLRLRESPGLNGKIQFLAYESEIFKVDDGPKEADGYVWWFLVAPYDESVRGWAVENYLVVIQNP